MFQGASKTDMKANLQSISLARVVAVAVVPWLVTACAMTGHNECCEVKGLALIPAGELKWTPLPGIPGAEQVMLCGDTAKSPHRALFKYPVGLSAPLHSHSHGDRAVIVSGWLSLGVPGAATKKLGPGSYFSIAAGIDHVTKVEGDQPCVFYIERTGPFDVVIAADGAAKKN